MLRTPYCQKSRKELHLRNKAQRARENLHKLLKKVQEHSHDTGGEIKVRRKGRKHTESPKLQPNIEAAETATWYQVDILWQTIESRPDVTYGNQARADKMQGQPSQPSSGRREILLMSNTECNPPREHRIRLPRRAQSVVSYGRTCTAAVLCIRIATFCSIALWHDQWR